MLENCQPGFFKSRNFVDSCKRKDGKLFKFTKSGCIFDKNRLIFNYLAPQSFGRELSQSVIGVQMAAAYVGIMLAPPLCGAVGQALGMGVFPVFLAVFFAVMLAATAAAKRLLCTRRQK